MQPGALYPRPMPGDDSVSAALLQELLRDVESLRAQIGAGVHDVGTNFALDPPELDLFVAKLTSVRSDVIPGGSEGGTGWDGDTKGNAYGFQEMKPGSTGIGYVVKANGRAGNGIVNPAYSVTGSDVTVNTLVWMREKFYSHRTDTAASLVYEFLGPLFSDCDDDCAIGGAPLGGCEPLGCQCNCGCGCGGPSPGGGCSVANPTVCSLPTAGKWTDAAGNVWAYYGGNDPLSTPANGVVFCGPGVNAPAGGPVGPPPLAYGEKGFWSPYAPGGTQPGMCWYFVITSPPLPLPVGGGGVPPPVYNRHDYCVKACTDAYGYPDTQCIQGCEGGGGWSVPPMAPGSGGGGMLGGGALGGSGLGGAPAQIVPIVQGGTGLIATGANGNVLGVVSGAWASVTPAAGGAAWTSYGTVTPANLTADVNDYAPGNCLLLRVETDGSGNKNITGIAMSQVDGQMLVIENYGSIDTVTIVNGSGLSAAANRFVNGGAANDPIGANSTARYIYSGAVSNWRKI